MLTTPNTPVPVSELDTPWSSSQSIEHPDPTDTIVKKLGSVVKKLDAIEARLKRMESRLCQFMLDQGSSIHLEDVDAQR